MKVRPRIWVPLLLTGLCVGVLAMQSSARQYYGGGGQYFGDGDPCSQKQSDEKAGSSLWVAAPIHSGQVSRGFGGGYGGFGGYGGYGRASWSQDYPKADRQFLLAMKRLTRINGRSTEQVVDLGCDNANSEIENYPWIYAVQVQNWSFSDAEAKRLREFLLKGGFLMVDDFHGTADWESFMRGMRMVFPDRPIEDLDNKDEIFHVLYDLDDRFQVPGEQYVNTGRTYEKDGYVPKWRAIRDDKGRIVVAICHNMHLGDAWEWADSPYYPEKFASMAFRIGLDYIMYGMTH